MIFSARGSYCCIKTVMEVFMFKEDDNRDRRVAEREISTEVSCDYVLPDYLGEVRKILFTEARCLPLPTYMNGEELSVSGTVAFRMIYNDAEGRLSSVEFTADYENCERSTAAATDVSAQSEIAGFSMRLLGPRKISAKARVSSDVKLISTEILELSGSAAELPTLETAKRSVCVMGSFVGDATEREYAEPIAELDGVIADDDSEKIYQEHGLSAFHRHEATTKAPLDPGPLADLLIKISNLQIGRAHV